MTRNCEGMRLVASMPITVDVGKMISYSIIRVVEMDGMKLSEATASSMVLRPPFC